jgi:RNA polymerase sigma factor (TIGR02999 family)
VERGDELALEELLPVVYRELHGMARRYMTAERPDHTLQASALVNEAYLKLVDVRQMQWQNRAHFFGVSAQLMRRILVDFGRRRHYLKRGGGVRPVTFNDDLMMSGAQTTNLVALDDALKHCGCGPTGTGHRNACRLNGRGDGGSAKVS